MPTLILRYAAVAAMTGAIVAASAMAGRAACPDPPPPVRSLDVPRYYGDRIGSVVDDDKLAANKEAVAPLVLFVGEVAKMADRSLLRTTKAMRPADARCALADAGRGRPGGWRRRGDPAGEGVPLLA